MGLSIGHLIIILIIILVLFGAGKLPSVMSDVGRGLKALRDGMHEEKEQRKEEKEKGGNNIYDGKNDDTDRS